MKRFVSILLALAVFGILAAGAWANPSTMTIVSDASVTAYGPLTTYASLGDQAWEPGKAAEPSYVHPSWGPGTPGHINGATWISTASCPENTVDDSWRKFTKSFELCQGAYDISGSLQVNSDNAEEAYLNGTLLGTDGEVQGPFIDNQEWDTVITYILTPYLQDGENTLGFISRNYAMSGGTCSSNPAALTFKAEITYSCPIQVAIDIKPGSDPNCFNNDGHGAIPVAILGSAEFDVSQIDPGTVQLQGLAVKAVGKGDKLLAHIEDVNGDGFDDLVVQIQDQDGTFTSGSGAAKVTGNLTDSTPFEGIDSICIVP